jgi:hypothetical protein
VRAGTNHNKQKKMCVSTNHKRQFFFYRRTMTKIGCGLAQITKYRWQDLLAQITRGHKKGTRATPAGPRAFSHSPQQHKGQSKKKKETTLFSSLLSSSSFLFAQFWWVLLTSLLPSTKALLVLVGCAHKSLYTCTGTEVARNEWRDVAAYILLHSSSSLNITSHAA